MDKDKLKRDFEELKKRISQKDGKKFVIIHSVYQILIQIVSLFFGMTPFTNTLSAYPYSYVPYKEIAFLGILNGANVIITANKKNPIRKIWIRLINIAITLFVSINIYLLFVPEKLGIIFNQGALYDVFFKKRKKKSKFKSLIEEI